MTLQATANTGYNFSNWTGTTNGSTNPLMLTMNSPVSETANFTLNNVNITIATSPSGLLVSIDHGTAHAAPVSVSWVIGSMHTIATTSPQTAPGTMHSSTKWSDGGAISHTVMAPPSPTTYTVIFLVAYQLTTAVSPSGSANVTPASGSYYPAGTKVNLKASPNAGYIFKDWTGNVANANSASTTITISAPESVTANFAEGPTLLTGIISGKKGPNNTRQWTFTIANTGPGAANAAQFTSLKLTQTSGETSTPVIKTALPVTIDFSNCDSNAKYTVTGTLMAYQGGARGAIFLPGQEP